MPDVEQWIDLAGSTHPEWWQVGLIGITGLLLRLAFRLLAERGRRRTLEVILRYGTCRYRSAAKARPPAGPQ